MHLVNCHRNFPGVIGYGGRQAGIAEGFFKGGAKSFARGLSIIGLGASTIRQTQFKQRTTTINVWLG